MPKLLIYRAVWIFTIFGTDIFENRMHIHVGRKGTEKLCKIWLEPTVEIAKPGELSTSEQREVLQITELYKERLIQQWQQFLTGQKIEIIKVN
ncbi:DUF4160 domain-containing protein [Spirosoma sp. HMF3257]|uniref:DUF4160 domain-containing protein n=1 Tax=Spirosoma telluris TaxID=2183553 RepID=A0A327NHP3_9BACT|nr:DUF4160 domain-containing protein [Spirosoma telluris]RAI74900.1 hypothetical protein HMF3257_12845 [Spirosoma telluris]